MTSSELVDALRELDMTTRREHPDCFPDDLIDRDAVERWLDELEERGRRFGDGRAATA